MNIAFVDIGEKDDGFLQLSDLQTTATNLNRAITEGERLLLQVIKDAKGDKGPQLGNRFALHGPNLIYRPAGKGLTLSKNIKKPADRHRLEKLLGDFTNDAGITVRTTAYNASEALLLAEMQSLMSEWGGVQTQQKASEKSRPVGRSETPLTRILQTLFAGNTDLVVNNASALNETKKFMAHRLPGIETEIKLWDQQAPLFEAMGVNAAMDLALQKRVPLKSGGNITLEPTEAAIIIDVNSATHTSRDGRRSAALSVNLEAAAEVCRQIRLRNYSGTIIIDFIQMTGKGEAKELSTVLQSLLDHDPMSTRMIGMTEIGLMQITRKRTRPQLSDIMRERCSRCDSDGLVSNNTTVLADLFRKLQMEVQFSRSAELRIQSGTELALSLERHKAMLEKELARPVSISVDATLFENEYKIN
ncbi:MAG: ribonuclease E/G [Sneathiella sp.]